VHEEKRTAITLFDVRQDKKHMANNDFAVHFFTLCALEKTRGKVPVYRASEIRCTANAWQRPIFP
jgi:hypothetical protein